MTTLLLETATPVCSVALANETGILAERRSVQPNAHSSQLPMFIQQLFDECGLRPADLTAVCVSSGPGSYTGLRIGVSSAKGFCYALDIPLLSVPTLYGMAALYYAQHPDYRGMVCSMIDARRMECYTAIVERGAQRTEDGELHILRDTHADIIDTPILTPFAPLSPLRSPFQEWLDRGEVVFIGDGAEKTRPLLGVHPNAHYDTNFTLSATGMLPLVLDKLRNVQYEDVAYFEPYYLKDFVAKKAAVRGLGRVESGEWSVESGESHPQFSIPNS